MTTSLDLNPVSPSLEAFDDEREPTLMTGAPIIELSELDQWICRFPAGAVAQLSEGVDL